MQMNESHFENTSTRSSKGRAKNLRNKLDKFESEDGLRNFIELGWEILEPGREFSGGWHIDAICEHLEAVSNGEITRLLINIPPGCMKSLTCEVFFPAWEWGPKRRPQLRYVSASYSHDLTTRDNRKGRNLIRSRWYQELWGDVFQMTSDQDAKTRYDNDQSGFRVATSVEGLGTGERGDRFIIDDPHNVKDGESDAKRHTTELWFTETVPTRVNDPEKSAIIVIMQRVHELDVSGLIMSRNLGYEHLMLPMEFEPKRRCSTSIGFVDPRKDDNELLWPNRMTRMAVERDKQVMGSYATAGQYQQRPTPRGGGLFKRKDFLYVDEAPVQVIKRVRGWDLAASTDPKSAYTVGCRMSMTKEKDVYIEDVVRDKLTPGAVEALLLSTAKADGHSVIQDLPQDPGQAGKSQKAAFMKVLHGFTAHFSPESGSKEQRAEPLAAQTEAGNVYLVRASWNDEFLHEATTFPHSAFKDQIDAASRAYAALLVKGATGVGAAPEVFSNG